MNDLVEFLLARIAEDEERSRAAAEVDGADVMLAALPTQLFDGLRLAFPARVLAECEAQRRIVEAYQDAKHHYDEEHDVDGSLKYADGAVWEYLAKLEVWEQALKLLALPYADHPDYRDEWRPA